MVTKTQKKKKVSILDQLNIDKLVDKIDVDNLKISDFTNVLKKYSIPSFSEENNTNINTNINNILQNLKSKSQKKKKTVDKLVSKEEITEFFASKIKKDEEEIIKKNEEKSKTQKKKVSFGYSLDDLIDKAKNTQVTTNKNIQAINKNPPPPKIKYNPNVNLLLNTNIDPLADVKEQFNNRNIVNYNKHIIHNQNNDNVNNSNNNITNKKSIETKLIKITTDVLCEEDETPKVKQPTKLKTKEEKYQELLANQINIIETKINEYEFLSQHRHKNHPSLLSLSIDIINEKKKIKGNNG